MRKLISLLIVAAFAASSPTVAAAKEKKQKQRGGGDSEAARKYPTCFKGRAPAGAAKLVAPILFRYAPRRDEEEKGRKVNPTDLHLANAAAREGVSGLRIQMWLMEIF